LTSSRNISNLTRVSGILEVGVYLPQVAASWDVMLDRARRCEDLGIDSLWLYDHLYGPELPGKDSLEAWTLATALLTATTRLRVGHLVLCNSFRHPALLAKMASTLAAISGGRLELGLGSGSVELEHHQLGLPWGTLAERSSVLRESLEVITSMFAGGLTSFAGEHFVVTDVPNLPLAKPPLIIGGGGEKQTLPLVARYADIWNIPTYALGELDRKLEVLHAECAAIGRDPSTVRFSYEAVLALAPSESELPAVHSLAQRRFGSGGFGLVEGGLVGTSSLVVDRIGELRAKGFDHFVFFTHDRASDQTLDLLATEVLPQVR
jgi:alkanesulfonate monooxygenase SsuD/methylene tetrahydromethanopterin reductase-like flavin-dependent oxidoreductase (luciferase family)